MAVAITKSSTTSSVLTKSGVNQTWNDLTQTWNAVTGTWDNPGEVVTNVTKSTVTQTKVNKS